MTPEQLHPMTHEHLQALLTQADEEQYRGNYDQAEKLANDVLAHLAFLTSSGDKEDSAEGGDGVESDQHRMQSKFRANAIRLLGLMSHGRGDYPKALEHHNSALLQSEEIADMEGIAKALGNIGIVHLKLSDYPKALEYYGKALSIDEDLGNTAGVALWLGNIGNVHVDLSDYPKALEYYGKALAIDEQLGIKRGIARHLGNIGNVHSYLSDYPKALEYYGKALGIDEELGDKAGVAYWLAGIGLVHSNLFDYPKALEYHSKALSIDKELRYKAGIARHLGNIGEVHRCLSDYPKALEYYGKALTIAEELGSKSGVAINLGNIGEVQRNLSDYPMALEYYGKALAIDEQLGNKQGIARHLGNIGATYATTNFEGFDAVKAEEFLLQALAIFTEIGAKFVLVEFHKTLSEFYEHEQRLGDAFEHFKKHIAIKDEINIEETKRQESIREQRKAIELAKAKADAEMSATTSLLHRVLPQSIAMRILEGEEEIADYFPAVSILFADIKGFTVISADMPAYIVVRFLKFVFGEFDRIMAKHGCEKIKTIGDGYMAVAGAPITCEDHAERITQAALEMQETIHLPQEIREHIPEGAKLGVRIGIHTGPVVAGVVGADRFVYDIYSDAVNLASRMESHGEVNRIHVSADFARHLQNRFVMTKNTTHGITFEKRGEMAIKGKGSMRTFFLEKANS